MIHRFDFAVLTGVTLMLFACIVWLKFFSYAHTNHNRRVISRSVDQGVEVIIAVFHELCIAVPCHMLKLWTFIGIMFQVPLVLITNYQQNMFQNSMARNMVFWFIFCILGQPMSILRSITT